jgi:hypothetical protein
MVLDAVSDLFGSDAPPAVRRPVLEVDFGGNADAWRQHITAVQFEASLLPGVDAAHLYFSSNADAPEIIPGDSGSIALGYEDNEPTVILTGQAMSVERNLSGLACVMATNGGSILAGTRLNRSYDQQSAGEIVSDLASAIETDSLEDGVSFPHYAVDTRRNALQHIAVLARKCNFIAYFSPEGKLNFVPFSPGSPVQTFTYAVDILALEITESTPPVGEVTLVGEGAAGSQGSDAWSWLVKDPTTVTGTAGDGDPKRPGIDASLRSSDAAQSAALGEASAASLTQTVGRITVPGAPLVTLGSVIEIADAPQDSLNGQCFVRRVRHSYSKRSGFVTRIDFGKIGEGGGLGGLLSAVGGLL